MMRNNSYIKLIKDENLEMLHVLSTERKFAAQSFSPPILHNLQEIIIKCMDVSNFNAKYKSLLSRYLVKIKMQIV